MLQNKQKQIIKLGYKALYSYYYLLSNSVYIQKLSFLLQILFILLQLFAQFLQSINLQQMQPYSNKKSAHSKYQFDSAQIYDHIKEVLIKQEKPLNFQERLKKTKHAKLIVIFSLFVSLIIYRIFKTSILDQGLCIHDTFQEFTFSLNRQLYKRWDNFVIGIGQVIMDFWIITSFIFWYYLSYLGILLFYERMLNTKNFRLPMAVFLFYGIRSIFLEIQGFPFPKYMVWHSPGFFSFTVPYGHTRDFFYSGHTGGLCIIMLQFHQFIYKKNSKMWTMFIWFVTFICLVYMMNMLIVTRVHYTIDIGAGLLFSSFFFRFSQKYVYFVDRFVSIPYFLGRTLAKKISKKQTRSTQISDQRGEQVV